MNDTSFPNALPAGSTLRGGDFVLQNVLGQGGFGITYRALDRNLQRPAAIKEFFPQGSQRMGQNVIASGHSDSDFAAAREQFLREARTLAQFNHPHIVNVYTVFEENDSAYMVMEFVQGTDLSKTVGERGALPLNQALEIVHQIGGALQEVHRAGLLHLDVKPENILLQSDGASQAGSTPGLRAVLLDFGLTRKLETATGYATTRLDAFARFGTAGYAPLEQYSRSGQTGVATDVYALAATLYFLLTAQTPIEATERASGVALPDARSFNHSVSAPIVAALASGLEMQAAARPQSVQAFLRLLDAPDSTLQTVPAGGIPAPSTPGPPQTPRPYRDDDDDDFERGDSDANESVEEILEQLFGAPNRGAAPRPQAPIPPPMQRPPNPFPFPQPMPRRAPVSSCSCAPGCIGFIIFLYFLMMFLSAVLNG